MQRASIAAMFSFSTRRPAESRIAATRKTGQAAEDNAAPEGPANTNTGTGFARAKTGHALCRRQRPVAHGRDEGHPRNASAVARSWRSRYWRRGPRSLEAHATQDDFSRRSQPWLHGQHRGGSYAKTWRVRSSVPRRQRGLTRRSSGAPTACHQGPAGGTRKIFASRALAAYRRLPLSSNVRRHQDNLSRLPALRETSYRAATQSTSFITSTSV